MRRDANGSFHSLKCMPYRALDIVLPFFSQFLFSTTLTFFRWWTSMPEDVMSYLSTLLLCRPYWLKTALTFGLSHPKLNTTMSHTARMVSLSPALSISFFLSIFSSISFLPSLLCLSHLAEASLAEDAFSLPNLEYYDVSHSTYVGFALVCTLHFLPAVFLSALSISLLFYLFSSLFPPSFSSSRGFTCRGCPLNACVHTVTEPHWLLSTNRCSRKQYNHISQFEVQTQPQVTNTSETRRKIMPNCRASEQVNHQNRYVLSLSVTRCYWVLRHVLLGVIMC